MQNNSAKLIPLFRDCFWFFKMSQSSFGRHQEWDSSRKIYIRGLRSDSNKQQLQEAFSSYGKVLAVWIAQKPPGYAFLLMESSRDARESCVGLNNTKIGGYRMQVEMATGSVRGDRMSDLEERSSNGGKSRCFLAPVVPKYQMFCLSYTYIHIFIYIFIHLND